LSNLFLYWLGILNFTKRKFNSSSGELKVAEWATLEELVDAIGATLEDTTDDRGIRGSASGTTG